MHDVIIVGTRVAGAATALLLARRGLKVLAVDRATFPSDTLSTHQVQVPGCAALARWGLLDQVLAAGTPPARTVRFDQPGAAFSARLREFEGVDLMCSPRRLLLDTILVGAARQAGAELRDSFIAEELTRDAAGTVTGLRGRTKGGPLVTEHTRLVIGADGRHSMVARLTGAASYRTRPSRSMGCYTYWSGVRPSRAGSRGETGLFQAVAADPQAAEEFIGALTGTVPLKQFMSPRRMARLVGFRGVARLMLSRPTRPGVAASQP